MNLRSKTVGIVSALALSITMGAGIASADGAASGDTTVVLAPNADGDGCTGSASGGDVDFGTWTWNGTNAYVGGTTSDTLTLSLNDDRSPIFSCTVSVAGTGLILGADVAAPATALTAETTGSAVAFSPGGALGPVVNGSNTVTVRLNGTAISNTVAPDTYNDGTITFTISNAI